MDNETLFFFYFSASYLVFIKYLVRPRKSQEVGRLGLEPRTKALKGPCSTN